MSDKTKRTGSTGVGAENVGPGPWESVILSIKSTAEKWPVQKSKTFAIVTAVVLVVLSAVFFFVEVPRFVHAALGTPLGLMIFAIAIGGAHLFHLKHPEKTRLREKHPPMRRLRMGLTAYAVLAALLLFISSYIPVILGGSVTVALALCIYEFIRRSREEVALNESGQLDPRDIEDLERRSKAHKEEEEQRELQEFLENLPEEQRELLNRAAKSNTVIVDKNKRKKKV